MAPEVRQVARESGEAHRGDKEKFTGRKRKRLELLRFSESTSEYSFTHSETLSSDSDEDSDSRTSSHDYSSSSSIYDGNEYYNSSENPRSKKDTYSDSGSSYDSFSRTKTRRKGFPWDAGNQTGAGTWYPEYNLKILGKGHFAVVYLSYSKATKKYFAIKSACSPAAHKSLTREADILKQLNSPYIIEYLGEHRVPLAPKALTSAKQQPKLVPMVTEIYLPYIKRGTLSDEIRVCLEKRHVMKERVIRNYAMQILRGLSYLHSQNIIHCDIKGSNILMGKTHLKISDFGLSKHVGKTPSESRRGRPISRAGTRAWMAPEVHMRIERGFPSDVWSFGCTVVQMITGKPPVSLEVKSFLASPEIRNERRDAPAIPKDFKLLSSECIDFLRKCFLKDPKARWTCEQLLDHPFLKRLS